MPTGTRIPSAWLIGFLEGYDWGCGEKKRLTDGFDLHAIFERVDRICKSRAGETPFFMVALDLIKELDPEHSEVCAPPGSG